MNDERERRAGAGGGGRDKHRVCQGDKRRQRNDIKMNRFAYLKAHKKQFPVLKP